MATPTRQMSRPQVRPMQPFRQSQALRPAVQQPMQQPMQRAQPMPQRSQTMQQPMQQRSQPMQQQRSPMVQRPQAMQPTSTRVQQPMQRGQLNAPAVMPREIPIPPYDGLGMPGRVIPGTGMNVPAVMPDEPMLPGGGEERQPYNPTPMPKPVMTEAPAQAAPSGLASFLQYQNSKPGGGGGQMSQPGGGGSGGGYNAVPPAQRPPIQFGGVAGGVFESDGAGGVRSIEPSPYSRGGGGGSGGGGVGMMMPNNPNETGMTMSAFKRGGKVTSVKKYAKGGTVKSTPVKASSRGDGIAQRGKTKGKIY